MASYFKMVCPPARGSYSGDTLEMSTALGGLSPVRGSYSNDLSKRFDYMLFVPRAGELFFNHCFVDFKRDRLSPVRRSYSALYSPSNLNTLVCPPNWGVILCLIVSVLVG